MKKKMDLIKTIYVVLMIIALLLCQALKVYDLINMLYASKVIIGFGIGGLILYIIDKIINKSIDKYDVLMFLLMVLGIISTIFSVDIITSLWGFQNRNEGLFVIITYYIVFLLMHNMHNKVYKKIIISAILLYGVCNSIYAILQYFKVKHIFNIVILRRRYYSTGFEQNPNFLGSIVSMCLSLSLGNYFLKKEKTSYIYGAISVIIFLGLLTCGAMSANITFIIMLPILLLLAFIKKDKENKVLLKLVLVLIAFFVCFKEFNIYDKNYLLRQLDRAEYEATEIIKGNVKEKYGSGRIHIWKESLKITSDNLFTGVGIDNFYNALPDNKKVVDIKSGLYVDKAHNEYLQKLVTEGIFSLLVYLITLVIIFITSLKKIIRNISKKDSLLISLFLAFLAYAIQAFFNISVIRVAPVFYMLMGLLVSEVTNEEA